MSRLTREVAPPAGFSEKDQVDFYEGKWVKPDLSDGSIRNWLVKKERFFLMRLSGKEGKVLDLGCGGGWRLFTKVGPVTGVDVSHRSLKAASELYNGVALASLTALPFADETFDYVVSLDVLGHIPLNQKDQALREILRVMKRGGRTLHYIEAESSDPIMLFARKYPELYYRYILEPEGHIGLETAEQTTERFRSLGFLPVKEGPSYKLILYVSRVVQYFDNEYREKSRSVSFLTSFCKLCSAFTPLATLVNLALTTVLELTDRLLPAAWAGGVLVEYRK